MPFNRYAPLRNAIRPNSVLVNLDAFKQIDAGQPEFNDTIRKIYGKYPDRRHRRRVGFDSEQALEEFQRVIQGWIDGSIIFKKQLVTAVFIQAFGRVRINEQACRICRKVKADGVRFSKTAKMQFDYCVSLKDSVSRKWSISCGDCMWKSRKCDWDKAVPDDSESDSDPGDQFNDNDDEDPDGGIGTDPAAPAAADEGDGFVNLTFAGLVTENTAGPTTARTQGLQLARAGNVRQLRTE